MTRLAIVGAGGFGGFIMDAARQADGVSITAVVDADAARAQHAADAHGARVATLEGALGAPDVDAVVIATPPASHFALVNAALDAGKDVFCEKPFGANAAEARELRARVAETGRVLVVDHVLRYNALLIALRRLQERMGWHPRRFFFENDAADESLPPEHWFWDQSLSGGIFVEHGVHFFDVAQMFLDTPAQSVVAAETRRAGWPGSDIVSATVAHGDALATHTHSFTHLHRAERQLMRLDFGPAEVRIDGWIPVSAELVAFTDDAGEASIRELLAEPGLLDLPGVELPRHPVLIESADASGAGATNRPDAARRVTVRLTLGGEPAKQAVYAASVAAALSDLHACRADTTRWPRSNAVTAAAAVTVAEHATRAAQTGAAQTIDPNETPEPRDRG